MEYISWEDFAKVQIQLGTVTAAEVPEGSEKVIKLTVDFAEGQPRTIFAGIKKWFAPETLIGKQLPFVTNIAPRRMGSLGESQGMLVAAAGIIDDEEQISLLEPSVRLPDGSEVR